MSSNNNAIDKPVVVVTHRLHEPVLELLRQHCDVIENQTEQTLPREEVLKRCKDADALLAFMPDRVDEAFLSYCPRLKIISAALKGYDNFDVAACQRQGVYLTYVPDLLTVPTAELAIGLTIALMRNIRCADEYVRSGEFAGWSPRFYGLGLEESTVGLLGFGEIGQAIASRLNGWGCRILIADKVELSSAEQQMKSVVQVDVERLLRQSDVIILGLPLTQENQFFMNDDRLGKMKSRSYLINPCRGSVVDESAVLRSLQSGHLAGYAADVFEMEDWARKDRPDCIDPSLLQHPGTLFTAHIGSAVANVRKAIEERAASNIIQFLSGTQPGDMAVNFSR